MLVLVPNDTLSEITTGKGFNIIFNIIWVSNINLYKFSIYIFKRNVDTQRENMIRNGQKVLF